MPPKDPFKRIIILLTAGFFLLLNSCTQTSYMYGVVGNPAVSADEQLVTVLVAETRSTTRQVNGGYRSSEYNSSWWLKQYETATGKLIKKKKIITEAAEENQPVICYGGYGDKIWLHSNGLKAYSINSLDEMVNEEQLAANNSVDKNNFPADQRFIDAQVVRGYINFTAASGSKYRIDLNTLQIGTQNDASEKAGAAIIDQLRSSNTQNINYGLRCDTLNGKVHVLAQDSITAAGSSPGNSMGERAYKQLHLFTADYTTVNAANHRFYRYSNMKQLSGEAYINAVFVTDAGTGKIIKPTASFTYLVLHNDSLINDARSFLTAVDNNNKTVWQTNTGLGIVIFGCTAGNKYCFLSGNKHYLLAPHVGCDMLCMVSLQNGRAILPSLSE